MQERCGAAHRRGDRVRRVSLTLATGVALSCVLTACVSQTRSTAPQANREKPALPSKPAGFRAQQMLLSAGVPSDVDGNGFPDQIPVTVYLFGDGRYELPVAETGSFEFEIKSRGGQDIGLWRFPVEETARAVGGSSVGTCYRFALQLAPGRDRIRAIPASLRAIFTNEETGQKIISPGSATIRLGSDE